MVNVDLVSNGLTPLGAGLLLPSLWVGAEVPTIDVVIRSGDPNVDRYDCVREGLSFLA